MTEQQKARLADIIDAYGCYQYLLGKAYANGDMEQTRSHIKMIKAASFALSHEFKIEMPDLSYL